MEIKSLKDIKPGMLADAFMLAFADYDIRFDRMELQAMLKRRGFCPELSFAAFEGDEIVSFIFNGIGKFDGYLTAYDTGTGTVKTHRGQGLANRIFEYSIPYLQQAGISHYLLEVLQNNAPAVKLYSRQGFVTTREFNCYRQSATAIHPCSRFSDTTYSIRAVSIQQYMAMPDFNDFDPSWQNSRESIARAADTFVCIGAFDGDIPVGYCVTDLQAGDITQIAVSRSYRRKGIGARFLAEALRLNMADEMKVINIDIDCNSINSFLEASGMECRSRQYEMIKKLEEV